MGTFGTRLVPTSHSASAGLSLSHVCGPRRDGVHQFPSQPIGRRRYPVAALRPWRLRAEQRGRSQNSPRLSASSSERTSASTIAPFLGAAVRASTGDAISHAQRRVAHRAESLRAESRRISSRSRSALRTRWIVARAAWLETFFLELRCGEGGGGLRA